MEASVTVECVSVRTATRALPAKPQVKYLLSCFVLSSCKTMAFSKSICVALFKLIDKDLLYHRQCLRVSYIVVEFAWYYCMEIN